MLQVLNYLLLRIGANHVPFLFHTSARSFSWKQRRVREVEWVKSQRLLWLLAEGGTVGHGWIVFTLRVRDDGVGVLMWSALELDVGRVDFLSMNVLFGINPVLVVNVFVGVHCIARGPRPTAPIFDSSGSGLRPKVHSVEVGGRRVRDLRLVRRRPTGPARRGRGISFYRQLQSLEIREPIRT